MARILLLEDDPDRIIWLARRYDCHDIQGVQTCGRAHEVRGNYDLALLDHDLGGRQLESHDDCGLTFVQMCKTELEQTPYVLLHSFNEEGAKAMNSVLPYAIVAPWRSHKFMAMLAKWELFERRIREQSFNNSISRTY